MQKRLILFRISLSNGFISEYPLNEESDILPLTVTTGIFSLLSAEIKFGQI